MHTDDGGADMNGFERSFHSPALSQVFTSRAEASIPHGKATTLRAISGGFWRQSSNGFLPHGDRGFARAIRGPRWPVGLGTALVSISRIAWVDERRVRAARFG